MKRAAPDQGGNNGGGGTAGINSQAAVLAMMSDINGKRPKYSNQGGASTDNVGNSGPPAGDGGLAPTLASYGFPQYRNGAGGVASAGGGNNGNNGGANGKAFYTSPPTNPSQSDGQQQQQQLPQGVQQGQVSSQQQQPPVLHSGFRNIGSFVPPNAPNAGQQNNGGGGGGNNSNANAAGGGGGGIYSGQPGQPPIFFNPLSMNSSGEAGMWPQQMSIEQQHHLAQILQQQQHAAAAAAAAQSQQAGGGGQAGGPPPPLMGGQHMPQTGQQPVGSQQFPYMPMMMMPGMLPGFPPLMPQNNKELLSQAFRFPMGGNMQMPKAQHPLLAAKQALSSRRVRQKPLHKSKYTGVYWQNGTKPWVARIMIEGKSVHLGYYDTEMEAAKSYDEHADALNDEFTAEEKDKRYELNFPDASPNTDETLSEEDIQSKKEATRKKVKEIVSRKEAPEYSLGLPVEISIGGGPPITLEPNSRATKYRGVCWNKCNNSWKASIKINGKNTHIGYFANVHEAGFAYDLKAMEVRGSKAVLNFKNHPVNSMNPV